MLRLNTNRNFVSPAPKLISQNDEMHGLAACKLEADNEQRRLSARLPYAVCSIHHRVGRPTGCAMPPRTLD